MGYPDTFQGYMIHDEKKWSDFKKEEVSAAPSLCESPAHIAQYLRTIFLPAPIDSLKLNTRYQCSHALHLQFKPKPFEDRDIDIKIEACGVCGSDVHTITGGWGDFNKPICVGHEIVGKAIKVGKSVTTVKVGDRVGVGAQIWACLECDVCKSGPGGNENYCPNQGELELCIAHRSEC